MKNFSRFITKSPCQHCYCSNSVTLLCGSGGSVWIKLHATGDLFPKKLSSAHSRKGRVHGHQVVPGSSNSCNVLKWRGIWISVLRIQVLCIWCATSQVFCSGLVINFYESYKEFKGCSVILLHKFVAIYICQLDQRPMKMMGHPQVLWATCSTLSPPLP